jgi:hypothetical protein
LVNRRRLHTERWLGPRSYPGDRQSGGSRHRFVSQLGGPATRASGSTRYQGVLVIGFVGALVR